MYYATIKKGSKRYGIAAWSNPDGDGNTCLAHAQTVFLGHGIGECNADFDCRIGIHRDDVTKQKNWGGMLPDAPTFTDSDMERKRLSELSYAKTCRMCGNGWAYFVDMFTPEVITESDFDAITI